MIRRVLITGGSGFIGTNLVDFFTCAGAVVLNVDHSPPKKPEHSPHWRGVDLLKHDALRTTVEDFAPTHVLHFAARTDLNGRDVSKYAANVEGVTNLLAALSRVQSIERVVFASSRMVCRIGYQPRDEADYCPNTVYGQSKVEAERIIRAARLNVPWVIVRPTSIWGPWFEAPYKQFFLSIARGRYFHVGENSVRKSFGYVGNLVHQVDRLLTAPEELFDRKVLYLADYLPLEVRDWAERIRREAGERPIRTIPYRVAKTAALVGDAVERTGWKRVPLTSFRLDNLLTEMVYDTRPLEEIVGPLPYSLDEGTARTVAWLRERGEIQRE
jgi:GlcNAc-P-P-Und epimerase